MKGAREIRVRWRRGVRWMRDTAPDAQINYSYHSSVLSQQLALTVCQVPSKEERRSVTQTKGWRKEFWIGLSTSLNIKSSPKSTKHSKIQKRFFHGPKVTQPKFHLLKIKCRSDWNKLIVHQPSFYNYVRELDLQWNIRTTKKYDFENKGVILQR